MQFEQISFGNLMASWEYDTEIDYVAKELKKDLLKGDIKYKCKNNELTNWYVKKFFNEDFLEDISGEDLIYIATELCNVEVV